MRRSHVRTGLPLILVLALPCAALAYDEDMAATTENPNRPRQFAPEDRSALADMGNRASVGLNGLLTAPADPVLFALEGDKVFGRLPAAAYTGRVLGAFAGLFQMTYRVFTGTFDVAFAWVPLLYMQSPVPRVTVLPWAEHDEG